MVSLDDAIFQSVAEKSIDAVVIIDINGNIAYWNMAAEKIFGYTEAEILGKHMHDILPTKNLRHEANEKFEEFKKTGHGMLIGNFVIATALHKNGDVIDIQLGINKVLCGGKMFVYAFIRNISEMIDMRDRYIKLESQATTDELTGILNRRAFIEQSEIAFGIARRHKEPFSFLMLDVDYFKNVNDKYGHAVGDFALQTFVKIISTMIRAEDIFGRIGGEEFCISMSKTTNKVALKIAERIKKTIEEHKINFGDLCFNITVSIGLASKKNASQNNNGCKFELNDLMNQADKALYRAKKNGRNLVVSL